MKAQKIIKTDIFFLFSLSAGVVLYLLILHKYPTWQDESFYSTVALRLIAGDSLVSDEWHLSQFSAMFLYLPVKLWLAIKGSTNGIVLFLRYLYLCIHTGTAVGMYAFFRKKGVWAIAAAMLFFTQSPMRIMNLSYNSLFALFLVAMGIILLCIFEKQKPVLYILAGLFYTCAGICNPFFFGTFLIYVAFCLFFAYKNSAIRKQNILLSNKDRKKRNKKLRKIPQKTKEQDIFFSKKAFLWFLVGIAIAAACLFVFFLSTGGSFDGFSENVKLMLTDSEHNVFNSPVAALWDKIKKAAINFNTISLNLSFVPIVLFIALAADKKRKEDNHRLLYILVTFFICLFYTFSIAYTAINGEEKTWFFSLPLMLLSLVCYILTHNKNKSVFFCFWLPCILAAVAQFLASNLSLLSIGWVIAIANIAGTFFVADLFSELKNNKEECKKTLHNAARAVLCTGICLQILFQSVTVLYGKFTKNELATIENGPHAGVHIERRLLGTHQLSLEDLDKIKQRSDEDDPVLILSDMTWLYLYIDRPFGTYSAWQLSFEPERLAAYYEMNPEKIPKYIYISAVIPRSNYGVSFKTAEDAAAVMQEMFNCKQEKLSRGILLTVME